MDFPHSDILLSTYLACLGYLSGSVLLSVPSLPVLILSEFDHYELHFCSSSSDIGGVLWAFFFFFFFLRSLASYIPVDGVEQSRAKRSLGNLRMEALIIPLGPISFTKFYCCIAGYGKMSWIKTQCGICNPGLVCSPPGAIC